MIHNFRSYLVGALLGAERARLSMPANALVLSNAISVADEGLDAVITGVPAEEGPPGNLPPGLVGFQAKATKRRGPSAFNLDTELKKPGPVRILREGGTYILACCHDLNPKQRAELDKGVHAAARKVARNRQIRSGFSTDVWDAQTLVGLCRRHEAAVAGLGLTDFTDALSLTELLEGELRAAERPFRYDPSREEVVAHIRQRARNSPEPLLAVVEGFPGAGNTRTVAEALDTDELRDAVLYVRSGEGLMPMLVHMRRHRESGGILVVDDLDLHDGLGAAESLQGLDERWRVVVINGRASTAYTPEAATSRLLRPLQREAMRALVQERADLQPPVAELVARAADGYPKLGFLLADALRDDPTFGLADLARLQRPSDILRRALPDADARRHLGPVSLFQVVGFDDEVADEAEAVATAFDLDPATLRHVCQRELEAGRFVSARGRFRSVSPLIVAAWLAVDAIENTPGLAARIDGLPDTLRGSFLAQVDHLGSRVPALATVLSEMLNTPRVRNPGSSTPLDARLLRVAAAVVPEPVAAAVHDLFAGVAREDLASLPLEELRAACQILLWSAEAWPVAVNALFVLARNAATGRDDASTRAFAGCFTVVLSGSTLTYERRAAWLEEKIDHAEPEELPILGQAAAAGLGGFGWRSVVGFPGGGEPRDWTPGPGEHADAARTAWRLALKVRDRTPPERRSDIVSTLAGNLRVVYRLSLSSTVEEELRRREWSTDERALLAAGLGEVLRFERWLAGGPRASVSALRDWVLDDAGSGRLGVIIATPLWELHDSDTAREEDPPALVSLADELADSPDGVERLIASAAIQHEAETRIRLAALVAGRLGCQRIGEAAVVAQDWDAAGGALSVADASGEGDWATRALNELAATNPDVAATLVGFASISDERLGPILEAAETGRTSGAGLSALRFGARIRQLSENLALRLVRVVAAAGETECALSMLDQWVEVGVGVSDAWLDLATSLATEVVLGPDSPMTDLYVQRLMNAKVLDAPRVATIWDARMAGRRGSDGDVDRALTAEALRIALPEMKTRILELARQEAFNGYAARRLKLLSRLAAASPEGEVWAEVSGWPDDELRHAVHHMNWSSDEPDGVIGPLLASDRFGTVKDDATSGFTDFSGHAAGGVSHVYARQRERAFRWRDLLAPGSDAFRWADDLAEGYGRSLEQVRRSEAEYGI